MGKKYPTNILFPGINSTLFPFISVVSSQNFEGSFITILIKKFRAFTQPVVAMVDVAAILA
jgi:hypothetical protein